MASAALHDRMVMELTKAASDGFTERVAALLETGLVDVDQSIAHG